MSVGHAKMNFYGLTLRFRAGQPYLLLILSRISWDDWEIPYKAIQEHLKARPFNSRVGFLF